MQNTNHSDNKNQLIPREDLFANPDHIAVRVSPNGEYLSHIAPKNGVLNIYVSKINDIKNSKAITDDKVRGIRSYFWAYDNKHILYLQDNAGDENWQLHKVDINTGKDVNLTPEEGIRTEIYAYSHNSPSKIIIGNNTRNRSYFDIYELDLNTGNKKIIFQNDSYYGFTFDNDLNLRFIQKETSDGGKEIFSYKDGKLELFMTVLNKDVSTTNLFGFNKDNTKLYMTDSKNSNTSELIELDLSTKEKKQVYHNQKSDIVSVLIEETSKKIQAVYVNYLKDELIVIDSSIQKEIDYLKNLEPGNLSIISRSLDNKYWIIAYLYDDKPLTYYIFETEKMQATKLFSNLQRLEKYELTKMHPVVIKTRDNLDLVSYLSLPLQSVKSKSDSVPTTPQPMILLVHGGPSARDDWGLNQLHQWLANRGYAVLSVNYRGSVGFGKEFFQAGFGQWSAKMHDDLIDAVNWSINNKIADKNKICIMGGSYGGYATLVGLTFTPDTFACGVDIVGPSNLITLLESIPPYWKSALQFLINLTGGDPKTEDGREILRSKSPITYFDKIKKPLLIGHGANDPRVKQHESDQIVQAMEAKNIPVTYALYPDEGHGFVKPANRIAFYAITEGFLSEHLGGEYEPIGDDLKKSSIQIKNGKSFIKGLELK